MLTSILSLQLLFMGLFAAVDKVQLATGALYGFREDNNLKGQEYSWLGSILSLGVRGSENEPLSWLSFLTYADVGRYLPLYVSHPSVSGWEVPECVLHVLVTHDFVYCCMPQLGWPDGFEIFDGHVRGDH